MIWRELFAGYSTATMLREVLPWPARLGRALAPWLAYLLLYSRGSVWEIGIVIRNRTPTVREGTF